MEVVSFGLGFSPLVEVRLIPEERTQLQFAVLLDADNGLKGQVVDPGDVQCMAHSKIDDQVCNGMHDGALMQTFRDSSRRLTQAWVEFNLRIFEGAVYSECNA